MTEKVKEQAESPTTKYTLVKGPKCTGKAFGFRVSSKLKVEVGSKAVEVTVPTSLAADVEAYVRRGYLSRFDKGGKSK